MEVVGFGICDTPPSVHARYEHFSYDPDLGVRGFGPTQAAAFAQAAIAMSAAIADAAEIRLEQTIDIEVEAVDPELPLFDGLKGVAFEMAARRVIFRAIGTHECCHNVSRNQASPRLCEMSPLLQHFTLIVSSAQKPS